MDRIIVNGPCRLNGDISVQGSKNSVLPILAATLLAEGESCIENCPDISDTDVAGEILTNLGCQVLREGNRITVKNGGNNNRIPENLMRKMRSSVMFLGAILGRNGSAIISFPGGCELGPRPIDIHISALSKLGARFCEGGGDLYCSCPQGLVGCEIALPIQSVGATENIIMAATKAIGTTTIINAAREPEIEDLQNFLNKCGAQISGAGSDRITIVGGRKLVGCCHTVIPDRIVAATYLIAGAMTNSKVNLLNINPHNLDSVISILKEMNVDLTVGENSAIVLGNNTICAPPSCAHSRISRFSHRCPGSAYGDMLPCKGLIHVY